MSKEKEYKAPKRKWRKDDTELFGLALPATIWYAIFCYLPMFGIVIAFKEFKIVPGRSFLYSLFKSEWCGFKNFKFFVTKIGCGIAGFKVADVARLFKPLAKYENVFLPKEFWEEYKKE